MTDHRHQGASPLSSSWRRVASTHSLEDLLLDPSSLEVNNEDDIKSYHHNTTMQRLLLLTLGLASICFGLFGLAFCFHLVRHCYPQSTWTRMSCDSDVTGMFHRIVIQHGLYGVIVPCLERLTARSIIGGDGNPKSILQILFGGNHIDDMISRMSTFVQNEYQNASQSDDVLYAVMLIPILCGPVTVMAIAMNWFCMKIFKHNI